MKTVFVAGAYRARTAWGVERNIRKAEQLAFLVAEWGAVPLCPHSMYRYFDKTLSDAFWLEATTELLLRCDAVMLCKEWEQSSGTLAEYARARNEGIPVFHQNRDDRIESRKVVVGSWESFLDWLDEADKEKKNG